MTILSKLYEISFDKIFPLRRRIEIDYKYTIIKGAPKTGKTYLIYDYLRKFDTIEYLYINLDDIRLYKDTIFYNLDRFLLENPKIKILVLDNCDNISNKLIQNIKHLKSIIISTANDIKIDGFKTIQLNALDFEEYTLFDTKHQNITNSFNSFLKYGNLPEIIYLNENKKLQRNQEILQLITNNKMEFEILKFFILSSGELKSIHQLFTLFKRNTKISKDIFYKTAKLFETQNIIYFCQKYQSNKAPKKIFSYNHALLDSVTINKKFNNIFLNMIYLELIKLYNSNEIYYLDNIDFYIEKNNSIILSIPFFANHISLSSKILPIIEQYNITNITIITVNNEQTIYLDDIECEVLSFYNWALGL